MNILNEIFLNKRLEVEKSRSICSIEQIQKEAEETTLPALDFRQAVQRSSSLRPKLIAEIKKASPSKGILIQKFNPLELAWIYRENGAAAISVLTDQKYFQGHLNYLLQVSALEPRIPILRKDFIYDPYQIFEARRAGASAVLLIVSMLSTSQLRELQSLAHNLGMTALVEVHDSQEASKALDCGSEIIGVNNRNLRDFSINLENTYALRKMIPKEVCLVAESGIQTRSDVDRLFEIGVDAILVGEALVTAPDIAAKVRELAS
jgi:indole-3-glycerol phosphate synthase